MTKLKVLFIYPNFFDIAQPSLSITALTTYIHAKTHHKVEIFDLTFLRRNWKKYLKRILGYFDVIAISVTQLEYSGSLTISKFIKDKYPNKPIIWGGISPSLEPEKVIGNKEIDVICIGDGEETLTEYLDHLEQNQSLGDIKGIWFKKDGKIIKNEYRPPLQNINDFPYLDFDIWDLEKYRPYLHALPFNGSRNCPYSCNYCTQNALKNALGLAYLYRKFSPKRIADELEYQIKKYKSTLNFRGVVLYDDTLTFDKKFLTELCDVFTERKLTHLFKWACNGRVENLDESVLLMMKKAGCYHIFLGIESYSENIRKHYGKNFTNERVEYIAKICKKLRIMLRLYFIVNDGIFQDYKEVINTINWAKKLKPETFHLIPYFPVSHSNMESIFKEKYPKKYEALTNIFNYYQDNSCGSEEINDTRIKYSVGIGFGKSLKDSSIISSISKLFSLNKESRIFRRSIIYSLYNYARSLVKYGGLRFIPDGFYFLRDLLLNDYKLVDFYNASLFKYMLNYSSSV